MEVHPLAAVFPMMTDDELADLADDIKANGLIHPIVRDDAGVLIDGRNRLRACEIAGVEPTFVPLNGHDAAAFIVSANLNRRNLSKGQQAIALAMIYPEPEKGGRGKKAKNSLLSEGFSAARLSQARTVLHHSRALALDVLATRTSLNEALATVERERRAGQSVDAQMAQLRSYAPDIADLVDDERLTLAAGIAEMRERQRRVDEAIDAARRAVRYVADVPVQVALILQGVAVAGVEIVAELDLADIAEAVGELGKLKGETQ